MAKKKPAAATVSEKPPRKPRAKKETPVKNDATSHLSEGEPVSDPVSAENKQDEKDNSDEKGWDGRLPVATHSGQIDGLASSNAISAENQKTKSNENSETPAETPANGTHSGTNDGEKNEGNVRPAAFDPSSLPGEDLLDSTSRARLSGEKRHEYWERMRKSARLAGLPRGQGAGTAYQWATAQSDREFPPPPPAKLPDGSVSEEIAVESDDEICVQLDTKPEAAVEVRSKVDDGSVSGLSDLPDSWGELPANAQLQVEIAWVTANRLKVRDGTGVNLSKALSPAPSYSALSWLETSILFPAKFADISVKATAQSDDEREHIRREKLSIEEIRGILKEMLDAKEPASG